MLFKTYFYISLSFTHLLTSRLDKPEFVADLFKTMVPYYVFITAAMFQVDSAYTSL